MFAQQLHAGKLINRVKIRQQDEENIRRIYGPRVNFFDQLLCGDKAQQDEAELHGKKISDAFKRIEADLQRDITHKYRATKNGVVDYDSLFDKLKRKVPSMHGLSPKARSAYEQLIQMDPKRCDKIALDNMKSNIRDADLSWFIKSNRWTRSVPPYFVQRLIAIKFHQQVTHCGRNGKQQVQV